MNDTRKRANQSNYSNLDSPDGDINFIDIHIQVHVIYSTNSMISHVQIIATNHVPGIGQSMHTLRLGVSEIQSHVST